MATKKKSVTLPEETDLAAEVTAPAPEAVPDEIAQAMAEAGDLALQDAKDAEPKKKGRSTAKSKKAKAKDEDAASETAPESLDLRGEAGEDQDTTPVENAAEQVHAGPSMRQIKATRRVQHRDQAESNARREAAIQENSIFYSGIASIQDAMNRHVILHGKVAAIETLSLDDYHDLPLDSLVQFSVIVDGRYKVMVPFCNFFRDEIVDRSRMNTTSKAGKQDYLRVLQRLAEKMYGAEIDFMVTGIDVKSPTDYAIVGSRKAALDIKERRNFIGLSGNVPPTYKVGDFVKAQVISVGTHNVRVCADGVDTPVRAGMLTFRYVHNLENLYHVGDILDLRIADIKIRPEDGRVQLVLDGRSMELLNAKAKLESNLLPIGTKTTGTITSVTLAQDKRHIVVYAWLDHFGMPAVVRAMDPRLLTLQPRPGDELRLEVYGYADNGFVRTLSTGYHRASTLVGRD